MNVEKFTNLLDRYLMGLTDERENDLLRQVFESSSATEFNEYSKTKWDNTIDILPDDKKLSMKQDMLRRIFALEDYRNKKKIIRIRKVVGKLCIAASFIIAVAGGYFLSALLEQDNCFEVSADSGQRSEIVLPDGTVVNLNSGTTVTYSSSYNDKNRLVKVDGEAFFDVKKNDRIPFVVETGDCSIKAVGTKFNVRGYGDETEIVTTLVEGKVITTVHGVEESLLPNQQIVFDKVANTLTKKNARRTDHLVPWMDDEILFENTSLRDIAAVLERQYNVKIIFDDCEILDYSYTGLIKNSSLTNVLDLISGTSPVLYDISGNVIKFSRKQ